jgi:hypothetical protein
MKGIEFRRARGIAIFMTLAYMVIFFLAPLLFNPFEPTFASRAFGFTFRFPAAWLSKLQANSYLIVVVHFLFWGALIYTIAVVVQIVFKKLRSRSLKNE